MLTGQPYFFNISGRRSIISPFHRDIWQDEFKMSTDRERSDRTYSSHSGTSEHAVSDSRTGNQFSELGDSIGDVHDGDHTYVNGHVTTPCMTYAAPFVVANPAKLL